jgi:hypothetical protein
MLVHRALGLAFLALAGVTLTAAGCGGSAPGTVTGSVHGSPLPVNDAVSGIYENNGNSVVIVVLTTETTACADFGADESAKNATSLVVAISQVNGLKATAPTAPGTFTVYNPSVILVPPASDVATLSWYTSDSNCKSTLAASGASGTVSITAVNNGAYTGTGDVTFDSGDHVTFTFDGASCAAITTAQMGLQTTSCM